MISKKVISDIVSKYSLGGSIEAVKWEIKDEELIINFINDSQTLIGKIGYKEGIGLKKGNYGIFNTSQLIKCLNILDGDILVDATSSKLNIADTNYDIKIRLADPAAVPLVGRVVKEKTNASFKVNDEFITRFVKSKDALNLDKFTIETRGGFNGEELVFTMGNDTKTDTIEFAVEATINDKFDKLPFDSNTFKEILKANRTYTEGEIHIHDNRILNADFTFDSDSNFYTNYNLLRLQDNE